MSTTISEAESVGLNNLQGHSNPILAKLGKMIEARRSHSQKCRTRNVNKCKKCMSTLHGVNESAEAARGAGFKVRQLALMTVSSHIIG